MINWIISSSVLIIVVICLRTLFKGKIRLHFQYALWLLVAVRLLIPLSFGSSAISVQNVTNHVVRRSNVQRFVETDDVSTNMIETPVAQNRIKIYDNVFPENTQLNVEDSDTSKIFQVSERLLQIAGILWIMGAVGLGITFMVTNVHFHRKIKNSRQRLEVSYINLPVYVSNAIDSPCLFGLFRPCIYVTQSVAENSMLLRHCVYHELAHFQQGDLIWGILRCICLSLHWYNPLVWWAARLSRQDAELACDESTIAKLGEDERLEYGKTLIELTCRKRDDLFITATTMSSKRNNVRERITFITKKPKTAFYAVSIIVVISALAIGCTFTNGKEESVNTFPERTSEEERLSQQPQFYTESQTISDVSNAEKIITQADERLRDGFTDAKLTYIDNAEMGWNYYNDNPWKSDAERDALAQAAIKELYTQTGFLVEECSYTTDGRSKFIFGKTADDIRKSIAFYSRDYGFTLYGNSTPYMGFTNARRSRVSDVQQLDSPYYKSQYEDNGAIATWFLEHSGIYRGEEIKGFGQFRITDTVFTHMKLFFDGGYYIVVLDEKIESLHEIMGPYPETPMLNVNGNLYYGTDETGPMGDSGAVGGYIEASVGKYGVPANHGESNFGCIGNPYTREDESYKIQVLMDDGQYHWFWHEDLWSY